jgi:hypothetical protein
LVEKPAKGRTGVLLSGDFVLSTNMPTLHDLPHLVPTYPTYPPMQ